MVLNSGTRLNIGSLFELKKLPREVDLMPKPQRKLYEIALHSALTYRGMNQVGLALCEIQIKGVGPSLLSLNPMYLKPYEI